MKSSPNEVSSAEEIARLEKYISAKSIICQSFLTAIFMGMILGLRDAWLSSWNWQVGIIDGISWGAVFLFVSPSLFNYIGHAKIAEARRGSFSWKDYYQPDQRLLFFLACVWFTPLIKKAVIFLASKWIG